MSEGKASASLEASRYLRDVASLFVVGVLSVSLVGVGRATAVTPSPETKPPREVPAELGRGWKTNFDKLLVPLSDFQAGGPGKDGIPAIDRPRFKPAASIDFLHPREPVIELAAGGRARAYPLQILVWHEIVNDTAGGIPVAVTFCPLCNTAIVFDRRSGGRVLDFGVSGILRNSDLVMYDRQTESWWQQFGGKALVGDLAGTTLRALPARIVAWADFLRAHPRGAVLTRETGSDRPYGQNPYVGYDDVGSPPFFPAQHRDDARLAPKERVVFIERGKLAVAVAHSLLARKRSVEVRLGGTTYVVRVRGNVASPLDRGVSADGRDVLAVAVTVNGKPVAFSEPFWFAAAAFRPGTQIVR